jgi:hypothetical protein
VSRSGRGSGAAAGQLPFVDDAYAIEHPWRRARTPRHRSNYPSPASWRLVLDALAERLPGVRFALIGRLGRDRRTSTALSAAELQGLLAHPSAPVDCFDVGLAEQLAVVEACRGSPTTSTRSSRPPPTSWAAR